MSSTAGPEETTPRRGADGTPTQEGRIHDARQDATGSQPVSREPIREEPVRTAPAGDTRAFPVTPAGEPVTAVRRDDAAHRAAGGDAVVEEVHTRQSVVAREKEQFGGVKIGSAFFGWLAATGTAVLLTAFVAAAGTAVGLATNTDVNVAVGNANETVGLVGVIVLLVILFVAYYCGGYVAGRMARFNGARQGFMVWVWAMIAAIVVAILGLVAGQKYNILANLNSFPRIPINEGQLSTMGIIAAIVVAVVALAGAVLGGLAGMHFHRKVDRAGFTPDETYTES